MFKIPDGFLDLSPEKAEVFYFIKQKLKDIFTIFGFSPIITSSVEYIETFKLSGEKEDFFFNYIDPYDGKPACFRYDFTPQIARFIKNRDLSKTYKIYYDGSVLRNEKVLKGRMREIFQAGVELINFSGMEGDIYLVILIKKIIDELKLKESKIFLNDVNIFNNLIKGLEDETYKNLKSNLINRDIEQIKSIISNTALDKKRKDFLINLPFFCGDIKLIDELQNKYDFPEIRDCWNNLRKIYEKTKHIKEGEILFDLAEVKGFEYHNGLVFDVYSLGVNSTYYEIITGGRYDSLLKKYTGKQIPSTGFAINLLNLANTIFYEKKPKIILLSSLSNFDKAYDISKNLSNYGYELTLLLENSDFKEKDFDLKIEIFNNKIFVSKKNSNKKIVVNDLTFYNKDLFQERLKEIL